MLIKRDFLYPPKNASRPLHIWLPEDYASSQERYPVCYFFDGHNLFQDADATYGKSWGFSEFLSRWEKPMILVGMECGHQGDERLSEYMPYPSQGWFSQFEPMGDITFRWILEDVKPFIDGQYRTIPFRECTAIGGSSMGGIMSLYGAIHYNRWFSKAACLSSSVNFCMEPLKADLTASQIDPDTRIYLSWGTREAQKDNWQKMDPNTPTCRNNAFIAQTLEEKQAAVKLECQVGGGHCEADWEQLIPGFMDFLWMH